jgi:predicted TIM-barrel fold metal-dependent hydrolase
MPVIDVDCHFEVALQPDEHPLWEWRDRLPGVDQYIADAIAGDLLQATPAQSRPDERSLAMFLPDANRSSAEQSTNPGEFEARFPSATPEERLTWLDKVGIDFAMLNPGGYNFMTNYLGSDRPEGIRRCNTFMAERLAGHTDRLLQVSVIDWNDLDGAVRELERMRALGSRAFWVRAEPFNGMSPAHPDWDRVWSAATDLGMVAVLHIGNTPAQFQGGWGNAGWEQPNSTGLGGFFRFANCVRHQAAEMMLAAMLYGGVFGRHPDLTIITEELGVGWLSHFVGRSVGLGPAGPWPFDLTAPEMLRRNLRVTPLIGFDPNVADGLLHDFPEIFVFSSDYPHGEGHADPITIYEPALSSVDESLRSWFLGANMAECFARMGDPLPAR